MIALVVVAVYFTVGGFVVGGTWYDDAPEGDSLRWLAVYFVLLSWSWPLWFAAYGVHRLRLRCKGARS